MSLSQTSDKYLGDRRQPIAVAVDRENTLPFKEIPTMPQTQIDTTKNPEGTPAKVLKMRPGNKRPPKWVLKDGKEDLLCDESSLQNTFGTADEDLM